MGKARLRFRLCPGCRRRFLQEYWLKDVASALAAAGRDLCPHFSHAGPWLRWRPFPMREQQQQQQMKKQKKVKRRSKSEADDHKSTLQEQQCSRFLGLPQEVLMQVLSYLPLHDLARLRLVSKAWSTAASDPLLPGLCLQNNANDFQCPWLLLSAHHDSFVALHPRSRRWIRFPFLFRVVDSMPSAWRSGYFLCAVSNGLFCLVNQQSRNPGDGLFIGNPFTGQWQFVTPHPRLHADADSFLLVMSVDPATGSYTLFFLVLHLAGEEGDRHDSIYTPLLYESTTSSWHEHAPIVTVCKYFNVNSIVYSGVLFAFAFESGELYGELSVLQYNLHTHDWREDGVRLSGVWWPNWHFIKNVGGCPRLPTPVSCQGRLFVSSKYMGERTSKEEYLKEECRMGRLPVVIHEPIGIWELHDRDDRMRLELETDVPVELLDELVVDSLGTDFILTSDADGTEIWLLLEGSHGMLVYDLGLQEWSLQGPGCLAEEIMDPRNRTIVYSPLMPPGAYNSV